MDTKTPSALTERTTARDVPRLLHVRAPFTWSAPFSSSGVWPVAERYVRAVAGQHGLSRDDVRSDRTVPISDMCDIDPADSRPHLRRAERRRLARTTTAVFQQLQFGVPVWGAYLAVQIQHADVPHVVSSQQSLHFVGEAARRRRRAATRRRVLWSGS
jgi:hypothetical protein